MDENDFGWWWAPVAVVNPKPHFAGASQRQQRQTDCSRGQTNLFYAHERNCDMYYKCENGTLREGVCPDGLVFDDKQKPEVLRCDLPFDIDCSYRSALRKSRSRSQANELLLQRDGGRIFKTGGQWGERLPQLLFALSA